MYQIVQFMIKRKWLTVSITAVFGLLFWAFTIQKEGDGEITKQQQLLISVGALLEQKHFSPKAINDAFSKEVFKNYIKELDAEKNIFIQADITSLKKFEVTIDDEIHGAAIQFFPAINAIYTKRLEEVVDIYKSLLAEPFDFTTDETVVLDEDKTDFANSLPERKEKWRKYLKYSVLESYIDLLDQKEKSKDEAFKTKSDKDLEKEAREKVLKRMNRIFERLKTTVKENDRFNMLINTIAETMDPHTNYLAPVDKRAFDEQLSNRFYGIGAQLGEEEGKIKIVSLITGGPAWKSGQIAVNDFIIKVAQGNEEPVDLTGYAIEDAIKLIRGSKSTEVKLTLKKADGTIKVVSIIREEIKQDEAAARSAVIKQTDGKRIGYIYLPEFYADFEKPDGARASVDVAGEVMKLKAEKVDGIIIDLRFNGGGSLYEVVQMVGLFIEDGPVVQVKDKEGKPTVLKDNDKTVLYDGPLTVMINELSASASEIFAAAIQDYNRGVIIGSSSSYGKGTVQRNFPFGKPVDIFSGLTEFGALKITLQKFYRVNGGSTQLKGVTPDIVLPDTYEYLKLREKDNESALKWDEIQRSVYNPSQTLFNLDVVKKQAQQNVNSNPVFQTIKKNSEWLGKSSTEKVFSLNINKYRQQQNLIRQTVRQNDSLVKLQHPMSIEHLNIDKNKFDTTVSDNKSKAARYHQWLNAIKRDLYINQAAGVVNEMVIALRSIQPGNPLNLTKGNPLNL